MSIHYAKSSCKLFLILFISCFFFVNTFGQGEPERIERGEKIESIKIGFITKELNLTPDEAQKFWPVYNKNQEELEKVREAHKEEMKKARENFDEMSDAQVEKLVNRMIDFRQQELDLMKKHLATYKEVLPIKKVARLYRAEKKFKMMLLKRSRGVGEKHRGGSQRGPRRRPGRF